MICATPLPKAERSVIFCRVLIYFHFKKMAFANFLLLPFLAVTHALQVQTWTNAGFAGSATVYKIRDLNGVMFPTFGANSTYSAQILGSFLPPYESVSPWSEASLLKLSFI